MSTLRRDAMKARRTLVVDGRRYAYFSLDAASESLGDIARLPFSLKVLLENLLRWDDGASVTRADIRAAADWLNDKGKAGREIAFRPTRVLMQDFTGVPAMVDLAAMRDTIIALGGDAAAVNPLIPVDLVIDHSVSVDFYGDPDALRRNMALEFQRNRERYAFLRWSQSAFDNFRVGPPGAGICHQVNCEYLAQVVWTGPNDMDRDGELAFPDTLVGTDSHTTMVNGLAVLGWGVGGIEAEAVMLGQPVSMPIPEVVGFRLTGGVREGVTATDVVLTVTQILRKAGVVGKFVEFCGPGVAALALADRLTIANMAPEYGATCGFFPIDAETIRYLAFTGRDAARVKLVEAYAKAQGMWRDATTPEPVFSAVIDLDLSTVEPSLAGPTQPQDRVALSAAAQKFAAALPGFKPDADPSFKAPLAQGADANDPGAIGHGDIVIAAITSCTNTSNPGVMIAAGLLAKKAVEKGLRRKPWVKTSLAPGSQVVADYLKAAGLQEPLDALGFTLVGFGCTTCIGNSGPLDKSVADAIDDNDLVVAAVLSGNRNFEGRINPRVKANYLASPPLVVAYAIAGSMNLDLVNQPLGLGRDGAPVMLKDIWPSSREIRDAMAAALTPAMFRRRYADVFYGTEEWRAAVFPLGQTYAWDAASTYIKSPPYFAGMSQTPPLSGDIVDARLLALLGDFITTDHISPAGDIDEASPAGLYLTSRGVSPADFNSYGARRGNDAVMTRGTFANIRLRNEMVPGVEGGVARLQPSGEAMAIFDAAVAYQAAGTPLLIIAGKEYGAGSSRDWAAKGTKLLGVKAVVAESFERIHRANLVGMGVLPLQFPAGVDRKTLGVDGRETFSITGLAAGLSPRQSVELTIVGPSGVRRTTPLLCRVDTADEVRCFSHGGILQAALRGLAAAAPRYG